MAADAAPQVSGQEGDAQVVTPPPHAEKVEQEPDRPTQPGRRQTVRRKPLETRLLDFFGKVETTKDQQVYFTGIAGMVTVFNPIDGQIIAMNSENMAKAWANLANNNERVKRYLEWMLSGGAWGEVFVATTPVIFAIAMNHGITVTNIFGTNEIVEEHEAGFAGGGEGAVTDGERGPVGPVS